MFIEDKLEIFLVTYNRAELLDNTLCQIFNDKSPIKNCEIKIIDNASTDKTKYIVKKYQKKFNKINYICNNVNIGGSANVAKAFEMAQKEYFWILCDDDEYDWNHWVDVEFAIKVGYDAIVVANYISPKESIGHLVKQMTFLPSTIYKKSIINDEVMYNIYYLVSTMFPHLGAVCEIINKDKKIYIADNWIVKSVPHGSVETYVRGYSVANLHPYMRRVFWSIGYINALQLIRDKNLRNRILSKLSEDLCYTNVYHGIKILTMLNKYIYNNSFKNICDAFCGLGYKSKIVLIYFYILSFVPKIKFRFTKNRNMRDTMSIKEFLNYHRIKMLAYFLNGKRGMHYRYKYKNMKKRLQFIEDKNLSFINFLNYQKIRLLSHILLGKSGRYYMYKYKKYKKLFRIINKNFK